MVKSERTGPQVWSGGAGQGADEFRPALRSFFLRRTSASDVDDLVQEVLVSLQARRDETPIVNPRGYIFTVAANVFRKWCIRRTAPRGSDALLLADIDHLTPERILSARRDLELVMGELERLPERTRSIFVAHRFEDMTYRTIADHHGISISAVEKHIMLALRALAGAIPQ